jgi:hypothetical protein
MHSVAMHALIVTSACIVVRLSSYPRVGCICEPLHVGEATTRQDLPASSLGKANQGALPPSGQLNPCQ